MSDSRSMRRVIAVGALLLHVLAAGALPLLAGLHAAAALDRVVHVEAEGGSSCPRAHNDYQCAACRLLASAVVSLTSTRCCPHQPLVGETLALRATTTTPRDPAPSSIRSRAPPVV